MLLLEDEGQSRMARYCWYLSGVSIPGVVGGTQYHRRFRILAEDSLKLPASSLKLRANCSAYCGRNGT